MKGLLLKDWYMAKKYCRNYLFIILVFAIASGYAENNFFMLYPMIMASILPVTLISYDERSKWQNYADTMPYKRRDIVTVKYLCMLIILISVVLLIGIVNLVKSLISDDLNIAEIAAFCGNSLLVGIFPASLMLPVIFKFGVEKGRIAYYITIGLVFGCVFAFAYASSNTAILEALTHSLRTAIPVIGLLLLAVSWFLSVKFYERREL